MFLKEVVSLCFISCLFLVQRPCLASTLYEENFNNVDGNYKINDIPEEGCLVSSYVDVMDGVSCLASTSCAVCFYINTPPFWDIYQVEFDFNGNAGTKIVVLSAGFEKEFVVRMDDTWKKYSADVETHGPKTFFFIDRYPPCDFQCLSNLRVFGLSRSPFRRLDQPNNTTGAYVKYGRWRDEELKTLFVLCITFMTFATFFTIAIIMLIIQKTRHGSW